MWMCKNVRLLFKNHICTLLTIATPGKRGSQKFPVCQNGFLSRSASGVRRVPTMWVQDLLWWPQMEWSGQEWFVLLLSGQLVDPRAIPKLYVIPQLFSSGPSPLGFLGSTVSRVFEGRPSCHMFQKTSYLIIIVTWYLRQSQYTQHREVFISCAYSQTPGDWIINCCPH